MERSSAVGVFLRSAREAKGLTLRAVQEAVGVSNAYLSQIESGKIAQPSPAVLYKVCALYAVSYAEAMRRAGYPLPDDAMSSTPASRLSSRIGEVSDAEEDAIVEYLTFLRSRRR